MKILKITFIGCIVVCLALFAYANLRILSPGEKQKMVELVAFKLEGNLDPEKISALQQQIKETNGVTACAINAKSQTASITFHKDEISESEISQMLTSSVITSAIKKDLSASAKGGCPVHKVSASISQMIAMLDLRTH